MICLTALVVLLAFSSIATAIDFEEPGPTFQAADYTTWSSHLQVKGSRRANIDVEYVNDDGENDYVSMIRLDLVGDAATRGYASGALLAKEIVEFTGPKLDKYFADYILNIDISSYPEPLQSILRVLQIKGAIAAPGVFKEAMQWVWKKEESFVPDAIKEEINGMAEGVCAVLGNSCDVTYWTDKIQQLNMLPEVIRMACTAFGAWGESTASGETLVQLRALDFGAGPFPNYTVIATHRDNPNNGDNAFVSVAFPGFVGSITGVSKSGVGISEKVWMVYGDQKSPFNDLLPGSYNGLADVFVLRNILEYSESKAAAEAYLEQVNRTWAIWIGIGDYETLTFDLVGYQQSSSIAYTDVTMPNMTGQPYIPYVAYVDKHPQPSGEGPEGTLPTALQSFYGNISLESAKTIAKYHQTGDVHIATYDFKSLQMYVAIGKINKDGDFGPEGGDDMDVWKAYNRPYVAFSLTDLWYGI